MDDYLETVYLDTSQFMENLDEDEVYEELEDVPVLYSRRNVVRQNKKFELNNERLKIYLSFTRYLVPGYCYTTKSGEDVLDASSHMDKPVYQAMNRATIAMFNHIERIAGDDLIYE